MSFNAGDIVTKDGARDKYTVVGRVSRSTSLAVSDSGGVIHICHPSTLKEWEPTKRLTLELDIAVGTTWETLMEILDSTLTPANKSLFIESQVFGPYRVNRDSMTGTLTVSDS